MEPAPENVDGRVVETHSFEHRVNWSHVALALAALYVAWKASGLLANAAENDREDDEAEEAF